jgi:hypothetical protein
LSDAVQKCLDYLKWRAAQHTRRELVGETKADGADIDDFKIFFHGPDWTDAAYFLALNSFAKTYPDHVEKIFLERGHFYLEKPSGHKFKSPVSNWYFCLSASPLSSTMRVKIQDLFKKSTN